MVVLWLFEGRAKGQDISEDVFCFQFLQKTNKKFPNFCPSLKKVIESKTFYYTNQGLFNIINFDSTTF